MQDARLLKLVESYVAIGNAAELAGDSRRAASYRSVANMLGVLLQGGEPIPVDFLARYVKKPTPESYIIVYTDGSDSLYEKKFKDRAKVDKWNDQNNYKAKVIVVRGRATIEDHT